MGFFDERMELRRHEQNERDIIEYDRREQAELNRQFLDDQFWEAYDARRQEWRRSRDD